MKVVEIKIEDNIAWIKTDEGPTPILLPTEQDAKILNTLFENGVLNV